MQFISRALLVMLFSFAFNPARGQIPLVTGSVNRATEKKASEAQIAAVERALRPMVEAIAALKNYQADLIYQLRMSVRGTPFSFDFSIREWRATPDNFYLVLEARHNGKVISGVATYGNGAKSTIYSPSDNLHAVIEGKNAANTWSHIKFDNVPYIAILYNDILRSATLNVMTPEQSPVNISDETLNGVACKKVSIGVAPQQTIYWYPVNPPHLPAAFTNYSSAGSSGVSFSGRFTWVTELVHKPEIFSPELPAGSRQIEDFKMVTAAPERAVTHALRSGLTTGTLVKP